MYMPFSLHFLLLFMCLTGVRDAEIYEYGAETDASESEVGYDNNYLKKVSENIILRIC